MKTILKSLAVATLLGSTSQAAVIYSGSQNIDIPADFTGVSINLLTSATANTDDLTNYHVNFFFGGSGIGNRPDFQPVREGTANSDFIVNLPFGSIVGPGSTFSSGFGGSANGHIGNDPDQIGVGEVGFIGFSIENGADTHYGFMRVEGGNADNPGRVLDWSYEDQPDTAITVVPEPSTTTLIGFAGLGLLLRRRK